MAKEKDGSIKLNSRSFLSKALSYLFISALIMLIVQVAVKIYVGSFELSVAFDMMATYLLAALFVTSGILLWIVKRKRNA